MSKVVGWLLVLLPLSVQAGQAVCTAQKCSATAGVSFKIVIPETARIRVDDHGAVKSSLNNGHRPVYTLDKGLMTISDP